MEGRPGYVEVVEHKGGSRRQRFAFRHVAGNGVKQASPKRYVTRWGAKRAARKLYPGVEVRDYSAK